MASSRSLTKSLLLTLISLQHCATLALPASQPTLTSTGSGITTQLPSSTVQQEPGTTGTILTSLETSGYAHSQPFATTTVTSPTPSLTASLTIVQNSSPTSMPTSKSGGIPQPQAGQDAFQPIAGATEAPPNTIPQRGDHPVPRVGIVGQNGPISTNKFYANLFLGSQTQGVWTHPYSVSWSHGGGNAKSWGLAVAHIEANQRAYGPTQNNIPGSPVQYFINPIGIQSVILSAAELGGSTVLTTDSSKAFSVNANLQPSAGSSSSVKFPLVQGMGFVTGIYNNLTPAVQSSVFFNDVVTVTSPRAGVFKYRATLGDQTSWLIYAVPSNGQDPGFTLNTNTLFQGREGFSGTIQIAKNPAGAQGEATIDTAAGVYPIAGSIAGSTNGNSGTYTLSWTKGGITSLPLFQYALPHLVASFDGNTNNAKTSIQLQTTTKGVATAVVADSWTMIENNLPVDMGFAPWSPNKGAVNQLSSTAQGALLQAANSEAQQNVGAQSNLNSMYYSGKALSKFATMVYAINSLGNSPNLANQLLGQLKTAYALFATNQQIYPLAYDTAWGGLVSSASYTLTDGGGADFGNTYYNDHHFHYGYFVYAAAIIGSLDSTWLAQNRAWVNSLVRDVNNPNPNDAYFPFSRSFDWYHGHSFAKGLFESGDSKDEESSSEDALFAYGMKMWGRTSGDASMEARGNLILSVMARSLQSYFLMDSSNTVQPSNFIANKVTGILFENKVDHTTYFGANYEYIQGIHMIPLNPSSALTRTNNFVTEEWNAYFKAGAVDPASNVQGGWKGVLYANLAIIDPVTSYNFFTQPNFDASWLDGGASQTWYIAYAAALGGA